MNVRVRTVSEGTEATLANGRWRLDIPVGAIDGDATVAIALPRTTNAGVQLEILPVSRNQFAVPITLIADCQSAPTDELVNYAMFWYDPDAAKWVKLTDSKVDLDAKTVCAPLTHFSKYYVGPVGGKAGW